jgi:ATP-dependent DNA helicase PIF1
VTDDLQDHPDWVPERVTPPAAGAVAEVPTQEPEPEPIPEILAQPHTFLTGQAGTGKTFLARRMIEEWPGTILAATTGIAAVNLGEGTTINALLNYFDTADLEQKYVSGRLTTRLANLAAAGVRRIVIDETSMMDARQLTFLTKASEELSGSGYILDQELAERLAKRGLEPISLVLTGDFCQLPPVKAPYAFEAPEWVKYAAQMHRLTKIHRQADRGFIDALNAARVGNHVPVCDFFRGKMVPSLDLHYDGPTILAKNDAVARFNDLRMEALKETAVEFQSARWGTERGDWKNIPLKFDLKQGALVMLLANAREPGGDGGRAGRLIYANGDLAHISDFDIPHAVVYVTLVRNGRTVEVEWVTRDNTIPLEEGRTMALKNLGQSDRIQGKMEVIGQVTYLPLRVAYATTCHKSQGLSMDRVQVDITDGFFGAPAMTYVALSRARTAEGIRLVGNVDILKKRCVIDQRVIPWL